MKVSDLMTTELVTVTADTTLKDAAALMLERGISGLPVVDGDRVLGVLSETDILFKERTRPERHGLLDWITHYGEDPPTAKLEARVAGDAMTSPAVIVPSRRAVSDAATMMLDLGIDRLPVVDSGRLVGIVTRSDLVRAFIRTDNEIQRDICEDVILRTLWTEPSPVTVTVEHGDVVIEGLVETETIADLIRAHALRVPGVVSVESKVTWPPETRTRAKDALVT
jgi:CBS domain-containing protein